MVDRCKTCGLPIYPAGVTYTGLSCMYRGWHPTSVTFADNSIRELTTAIKELTRVLSQQDTRSTKAKKGVQKNATVNSKELGANK